MYQTISSMFSLHNSISRLASSTTLRMPRAFTVSLMTSSIARFASI